MIIVYTEFNHTVKNRRDKMNAQQLAAISRLENYTNPSDWTAEIVANIKKYRKLAQGTEVVADTGKGYEFGKLVYTYDRKGTREVRVSILGKKRAEEYHPNFVEPIDPKLSWRN
jgi:hypothetical protein